MSEGRKGVSQLSNSPLCSVSQAPLSKRGSLEAADLSPTQDHQGANQQNLKFQSVGPTEYFALLHHQNSESPRLAALTECSASMPEALVLIPSTT